MTRLCLFVSFPACLPSAPPSLFGVPSCLCLWAGGGPGLAVQAGVTGLCRTPWPLPCALCMSSASRN